MTAAERRPLILRIIRVPMQPMPSNHRAVGCRMVWLLLGQACAASPSCCRWSASLTCSPVVDECSQLHEYLEHKTTTHHFADVHACLGSDPEKWGWQFDPATSSTTLLNGSVAVAAVPTPLRVTHAANCSGTAPTLSLQMDTVVLGRLIAVSYTHLTLPTIYSV